MPARCKPMSCICGCRIPMRIVIAIYCVLGVIVCYGQRQSLNITITRIVSVAIRNGSDDCPILNGTLSEGTIHGGNHDWSESIQGYLLASFYFGYLLGQIPCGIAADLLGPRKCYSAGLAISTALTAFCPLIIDYLPWYFVCIARILMGIVQSVTYPSMSVLIAHWVPPSERATLGAFTFGSNSLGVVLGNLLSGLVMNYTRYWPNTYYFWGIIGLIWCIGYMVWIYDLPNTHPYLTDQERVYLERTVKHYVKLKVPWGPLCKDKGIWALIIGQVGHDFTLYLMMSNMPKYFSDVLHMSVKDISFTTSFPFIGIWISSIIAGRICDYGIRKKNWKVKWTRSVVTWLAFIFPNSLLVLMIYMECNVLAAALCFTMACILKGPHFAGFKVNHMDITVNFNGIVMSMVNASGCLGGFISPLIVSNVAPNNKLVEWKRVGWIIWIIAFIFTTYYLFAAQATRAEWDVPPDEMEDYKKEKAEAAALAQEHKALKKQKKDAKKEKGAASASTK